MLRELFGSGVDKLRIEHEVIETPSKKKIEIQTVASNYHIEVNPSDVGIYDRLVIQELVKLHAGTGQILSVAQGFSGEKASGPSEKPIKVIVIQEADRLSREAQQALRRTMEKYMATCRMILCAESSSRLIPAIKSRVLMIRVSAPSITEGAEIITSIGKKEGYHLPIDMTKEISEASGRNLRRALMMAEVMKARNKDVLALPNWLMFITGLASKLLKRNTPQGLEEIRTDFYQLQAHMVPPETIFKHLIKEFIHGDHNVDVRIQRAVIQLASHYEHQMRLGSKPVIHFEAFAAQLMAFIKNLPNSKS